MKLETIVCLALLLITITAATEKERTNSFYSHGFYYNSSSDNCILCPDNCTSCELGSNGKVSCSQCMDTMVLTEDRSSCACRSSEFLIDDMSTCVFACSPPYVASGNRCVRGCKDQENFKFINGRCVAKNWIERHWITVVILGVAFSSLICAFVIYLRLRSELAGQFSNKEGDIEKKPMVNQNSASVH